MSNLLRCFGATENRLHLGQKQCKSKAETKLVLAMLRRSLRSLESKLKPCRFGSALGLHCFSSLELSHVLQYAPSFSLSAPCILLTLTHRLRFISNPYFDTPSFQKTSKPACNYFFPSTRSKGFNIHSKTDSASFT